MTDCKLCKQRIERIALTCSKGTICKKCAEDISLAEYQPLASSNCVLWCLAETFFRKGQGEEISFEQVWNEGDNLKLVKFMELFAKWEKKHVLDEEK